MSLLRYERHDLTSLWRHSAFLMQTIGKFFYHSRRNLSLPSYRLVTLVIGIILTVLVGARAAVAAENAADIYAEAVEAHWKWNLEKAIRLYTRVVTLDPNNARAYFNRGVAYRSQGDMDRALADFNHALAKNPDILEALYGRGMIYLQRKLYDKTIADMNRVIELDPKHSGAFRVRG